MLCVVYALLSAIDTTPSNELIIIRDISDSVGDIKPTEIESFINQLNPEKTSQILFAAKAALKSANISSDRLMPQNTNIEEALISAAYLPYNKTTRRRILLFSDGQENRGNALQAVAKIPQNILIESVPSGNNPTPDACIKNIIAPSFINREQEFNLVVIAKGTTQALAQIVNSSVDKNALATREVALKPFYQSYVFKIKLSNAGLQNLTARIQLQNDKNRLNNIYTHAIIVNPKPNIIWLSNDSSTNSLNAKITTATPNNLSSKLLQDFSCVVLDNLPASALPKTSGAILEKYLNQGGGVLVIGGDKSLNAGSWKGSSLTKILPTELFPSVKRAFCFAVDSSGSMAEKAGAGTKLQIALNALYNSFPLLNSDDSLSVVAFNNSAQTMLEPTILKNMANKTPPHLNASGATSIFAGTQMGIKNLNKTKANIKYLIMLTDGETLEKGEALTTSIKKLKSDLKTPGVSLIIIALGKDANLKLLDTISDGKVSNASSDVIKLPNILQNKLFSLQETELSSKVKISAIAPGNLTNDIPANSYLQQTLILGNLKDKVNAQILLSNNQNQPLAVIANSGFGKIAVLGGSPIQDWTKDPWGVKFTEKLLLFLSKKNQNGQISYATQNGKIKLSFMPSNIQKPEYSAALKFANNIIGSKTRLQKSANNSYHTILKSPPDGLYEFVIFSQDKNN